MFAEDVIFRQPSWVMESSSVRMAVTQLGGHMGPVWFCGDRKSQVIEPYFVSPWQSEENNVPTGQSEKILRGDFFCLPFGQAEPETHCPAHGNTAGGRWCLDGYEKSNGVHAFRIFMENALGPAKVERQYFLRDGEAVIYDRTTVSGLSGAHPVGHHAVLRVPSTDAALLISTSPPLFGMTYPQRLDGADRPSSQMLEIGAAFDSLSQVPLAATEGGTVNLSVYPSGRESTDLVQVAVAIESGQPAWTAVVNTQDSYLWFALRDAALLPSTLVWIENRGRQEAPWNGRSCVLGLEDVCSFFDLGGKVSGQENAFSLRGIRTTQAFHAGVPFVVSYLQGAVQVPRGFGRVLTVECIAGGATFTDDLGTQVRVAVDFEFVFGKPLQT